jgi:hypothetical protein
MREASIITPLHETFDHRYLTRPELNRCVAAVLAHTPHPSASMLGQIFTELSAFLLKKLCTGIKILPRISVPGISMVTTTGRLIYGENTCTIFEFPTAIKM